MKLRLILALALAAVAAGGAPTTKPSAGPEAGAPTAEPGDSRRSVPGVRKATAGEIMDAYNSGKIPEWFRAEDRSAVEKLRN